MLFSLVDADFIETEAHFDGDANEARRYRPEGLPLEPDRALAIVREHIVMLSRDTAAAAAVRSVRADLARTRAGVD